MTYTLEELKKINQLFPEISKTPDKWQEASKKYSGLDIKKFKNTFKQVNEISSDQLSNIKDLSADIAIKIGLYLHYKEKQYDKALKYFQEALKLKESSALGSVKILTYIGDLSETKGEYKESLNYYNTAIKKILDSNASYDNRLDIVFLHERLAATYENLYQMNSDEDKSVVLLTDALKHIKISLEICKELEQQSSLQEHEKSSSQVQEKKLTVYDKIYNTAAMIYETKGDPQKALDYYEKTLETRKELYGKKHFSIAEIYNNIGLFYHNQALILREVLDTKNNSDIDSSLDKIRFLCNKLKTGPNAVDILKRFEEEAKTELKNAAQILEKWGGDIYGNVQYNLGLIHKSLGEIQEAQQSFEKAVATLRELYPNGHTSIVKALNSLALIYKQDNKEQAFNCYTEALEIAKKIYGDDNNYIITTLQENINILVKSMPSKVKSSRKTWHKNEDDEDQETPKQALEEQKKEKAVLEKENIDLKSDEGEPINNIGPDTDIEPSSGTGAYDVRIINTYMSISDIAEFKKIAVVDNSLKNHIEGYLVSHQNDQVEKVEDFYSLLLNASISLKDTDNIQQILKFTEEADKEFDINSVLTSVDSTRHSPISNVLYSSKINLINLIEKFIQLPNRDVSSKAKLPSSDSKVIDKMKIIMEAPPMHIDYCLDKFLSPLYSNDTINELIGHITYSGSDSENDSE